MARDTKLLQPQYADKFQCIGPTCEDDCCHAWDFPVDKKTYQRYRGCSDLALKTKLDKCVKRNRGNPSDAFYANIKTNDNGCCPFLDADRLCALQRTLGEGYLSETCDKYPRKFRKVNTTWEMAFQLSCPEAARLALLNPKLMEFEYITNPYECANQGYNELNAEDPMLKYKTEHYFWPIRIFVITLLQNRNYRLWQRLVILGLFCKAVDAGNPGEIPAIIERYTSIIAQGGFNKDLEIIPSKEEIQLNIFGQLLMFRLTGPDINAQFFDCADKIKMVIAPEEDMDQDTMVSNYKTAFTAYYSPFMAGREYILENYLVNHVFKNAFPFGNKHVFDDYVMLIVHYGIIKMMLIGLAGYYKEKFTEDHVIQLIYSFSRMIEHNKVYLQKVYNLFADNELLSMPYMAIFIRN